MIKKAQEEIVGFVVVVVLIAIVALIFLAFSLRQEPETRESVTISQFLGSLMEYTTDCQLRTQRSARVSDLLAACHDNVKCVDGRSACEAFNQTVKPLVFEGLDIGEERPRTGYQLNVVYVQSFGTNQSNVPFIRMIEGNCTSASQRGSSEVTPSSGGVIKTNLNVCAKS